VATVAVGKGEAIIISDECSATHAPVYLAIGVRCSGHKEILGLRIEQTGCFEIQGYTDSVGSATFNKRLSEKRAQAVIDYLA
jgi:OmpA family protein